MEQIRRHCSSVGYIGNRKIRKIPTLSTNVPLTSLVRYALKGRKCPYYGSTSPVLFCSQQAVGLDHDEGVGRLHGEDEVVEVVLAAKQKKRNADHVFVERIYAVPHEQGLAKGRMEAKHRTFGCLIHARTAQFTVSRFAKEGPSNSDAESIKPVPRTDRC